MCSGHSLPPAYHWPHVQAVSTPPSLPAHVQLHHPVVTRPSPHRQTPGGGVSSHRHGDRTGGLEAVLCLGTVSGAQLCRQHQSSKSKAHLYRGKEIRRLRQPRNPGQRSNSPPSPHSGTLTAWEGASPSPSWARAGVACSMADLPTSPG